jgi:hypothetical protein
MLPMTKAPHHKSEQLIYLQTNKQKIEYPTTCTCIPGTGISNKDNYWRHLLKEEYPHTLETTRLIPVVALVELDCVLLVTEYHVSIVAVVGVDILSSAESKDKNP